MAPLFHFVDSETGSFESVSHAHDYGSKHGFIQKLTCGSHREGMKLRERGGSYGRAASEPVLPTSYGERVSSLVR